MSSKAKVLKKYYSLFFVVVLNLYDFFLFLKLFIQYLQLWVPKRENISLLFVQNLGCQKFWWNGKNFTVLQKKKFAKLSDKHKDWLIIKNIEIRGFRTKAAI